MAFPAVAAVAVVAVLVASVAVAVEVVVAAVLPQPVLLLQLGANLASVILVVAAVQILWINTRLLPAAIRPPAWRLAGLVLLALFYGAFAVAGLGEFLTRLTS
jgi:hypothetical protein